VAPALSTSQREKTLWTFVRARAGSVGETVVALGLACAREVHAACLAGVCDCRCHLPTSEPGS
jgi:hypothetical protein